MRWWLLGSSLLVLLLRVNPALAHSAVVLCAPNSDEQTLEVATRLRGELLSLDIQVSPRPAEPPLAERPASQRAELLRELEVAMDVTASEVSLEVTIWLWRRGGASRWLTLTELRASPNSAEKLAIRAAEALSTRFLELQSDPEAAPLPTPARPDLAAPSAPSESSPPSGPQLELGAVLFKPAQGLSSSLLPLLRFEWALNPSISLQASLAAFGGDNRVESELGGARVSNHYGTIGINYFPADFSDVRPFVGLATGALLASVQGWADAPLKAHRQEQLLWLLELSVGAQFVVSPRYFFTLAGHVHFTQPTLAIHVVDSVVALEGRPNWVASLTAGARL